MTCDIIKCKLYILLYLKGLIMTKAELMEIKKRFKYTDCSFSGLSYAIFHKNDEESIVDNVESSRFLTLSDDERKRFLTILSKGYSSASGAFANDIEISGDNQKMLTALSASNIPDANLVRIWAEKILDSYTMNGEYALLVFSDTYDVPVKDSSKTKTGESEEVFNYMAACICPFKPEKGGLMKTSENKLHQSDVIKVLGNPIAGFIYPSFNDRASDFDNIFCCVKNDPERNMLREMFMATLPDYVKPLPKPKASASIISKEAEMVQDSYIDDTAKEGYSLHMDEAIHQSENIDTSINQNKDVEIITRPEEEKEVKFEGIENYHKDVVVLPEDKIIERDVNGRKFFLVPEALIPYDKLKELLDSLEKG